MKAHRIALDTRGSGELTYIAGIDGLYEFDDGPTSGWKFKVGDVIPDVGAGTYKPKPGDQLIWFYASDDKEAKDSKGSGS
jgi:hypothetical protein